jgi:hypothetical protein
VVHELVVFGLHPTFVIETVSMRPVDWITFLASCGHERGSHLACQLGYAERGESMADTGNGAAGGDVHCWTEGGAKRMSGAFPCGGLTRLAR